VPLPILIEILLPEVRDKCRSKELCSRIGDRDGPDGIAERRGGDADPASFAAPLGPPEPPLNAARGIVAVLKTQVL
jgi:hypothetical protein